MYYRQYTERTSLSNSRASFWLSYYRITFFKLFTKFQSKQLRQSPFKSIQQHKKPAMLLLMKDFITGVFLGIFKTFKNSNFSGHMKMTTSQLCFDGYPTSIYLFKVKNRNTRTRCGICSKLAIKIPERRQWCRSGIFIVNFEHISHLVLVFLLLTLNI